MKKFVKLAAVFAALVLALSCFVACSSGDDDSSSNSGSTSGSGSGSTSASDSASVKALQGLWIEEECEKKEKGEVGIYILNNTYSPVCISKGEYYYDKEGIKFSVSGNKIIMDDMDDDDVYEFAIAGDTLTAKNTYKDKDGSLKTSITTYKKNTKTPIGISYEDFVELLQS